MLVSKSVQFTENFLLSRRTMPSPAIEMANGYEIQTRVRAHVEWSRAWFENFSIKILRYVFLNSFIHNIVLYKSKYYDHALDVRTRVS